MRITDSQRLGQLQAYQKQAIKKSESDHKSDSVRQADQLSISEQAKEMNIHLEGSDEQTPIEQLKSIKEAIAGGTYQVDSKQVAAKMLARIYGEG